MKPIENQRLLDLVRVNRSALLSCELITEDEYAWLASLSSSAHQRLDDYDELRTKLAAAESNLKLALEGHDHETAALKKRIAELDATLREVHGVGRAPARRRLLGRAPEAPRGEAVSISEHEAKTLADFEAYEAEVATLRARVAELEVELDAARRVIETNGQLVSHEARALEAERDLEAARGLIARLGDADALESLNALLTLERARVAEMERERDAAKADAARLREALERYGDHHPCCDYAERALYEDCACGFRAALASAPSAEPAGPDYSGLCSAPECGGHCGYVHAVGCEAIREYLAEHGGAPYKAPARTARLASTEPTPRDMRVAEAVHRRHLRIVDEWFASAAPNSSPAHRLGRIDLAAVVAKALEVGT